MTSIYIKIKNKSETVYLQSIWGTYSHIAWIRTEDPVNGIMRLITTEDLVEDARLILDRLRNEIEFEEIEHEERSG